MKKRPNSRRRPRAPRIRIPNKERALFFVDDSPFVGVLQRLSLSGGSAILSKGPIAPGTMGAITFRTTFGKVSAPIEFLQTGADGVPLAQAFHFLAMEDISSARLAAASRKMAQDGLGDVPPTTAARATPGKLSLLFRSIRNLAAVLMPQPASDKR